jgi:ATP:ADP antiporter, AAA family
LCALILLGFYAGLTLLPEGMRSLVAGSYYVFHSVFNLFVVSVFWAFMADYFNLAESKRLFPAITLGGSLGAILGSLISWQLAEFVGVSMRCFCWPPRCSSWPSGWPVCLAGLER